MYLFIMCMYVCMVLYIYIGKGVCLYEYVLIQVYVCMWRFEFDIRNFFILVFIVFIEVSFLNLEYVVQIDRIGYFVLESFCVLILDFWDDSYFKYLFL